MLDEIRILQLGNENWSRKYQLPEYVDFYYKEELTRAPKKFFDIVFLDREIREEEKEALWKATRAYTLFVTERVNLRGITGDFYAAKQGKRIAEEDIQNFLLWESRNYFPKDYGEKFRPNQLAIAQGFSGSVRWNGNYSVVVQGEFGREFCQILFWRNNIPLFSGQAVELWLEYQKDPEVEILLSVTQFVSGSVSKVQQKWEFDEKQLQDIVVLDNQMGDGMIFMSLLAKGKGSLQVVALHDRYSRRGHGTFLPGGERFVASNREEIFCYFDPGDRKPPLNVYFSGYKTKQGFEGYYMMRKLGCPFLLIAEPRLEGGCCYMGSQEYEKLMRDTIYKYMAELGFSREDVIFSGLSMGTCGALYYGCDIVPHALILGKPLASIGDVAENERLHRPGGFPTSLDMLHYISGDTDKAARKRLNDRLWDKFDATDWRDSKFIISYMIEDDYDGTAYNTLLSHLRSEGVQVYGKGIHGRHNDETGAIVDWFTNQFHRVLQEDFHRRME